MMPIQLQEYGLFEYLDFLNKDTINSTQACELLMSFTRFRLFNSIDSSNPKEQWFNNPQDFAVVLEVGFSIWEDSHTPVLKWDKISVHNIDTSSYELSKKRLALLSRKKYFKTCTECHELNLSSHMIGFTCHSCCEKQGCIFCSSHDFI